MGAMDFQTRGMGRSAQEAFRSAVANARYKHGHGGYTGTIAEKDDFKMMRVPPGIAPQDFVDALQEGAIERDFNPFDDKWGPAGCIDLGDGEYLFFGSASS